MNSLTIGVVNAVLATIVGTMAALGLQRRRRGDHGSCSTRSTYISIIIPEIVIALATLILFRGTFDVVNPALSGLLGDGAPKLGLGQPHDHRRAHAVQHSSS